MAPHGRQVWSQRQILGFALGAGISFALFGGFGILDAVLDGPEPVQARENSCLVEAIADADPEAGLALDAAERLAECDEP